MNKRLLAACAGVLIASLGCAREQVRVRPASPAIVQPFPGAIQPASPATTTGQELVETTILLAVLLDAAERAQYRQFGGGYAVDEKPMAYGLPTDQPGIVRSPYRNHTLVDVRGLSSGDMVRDPATNKPFLVP